MTDFESPGDGPTPPIDLATQQHLICGADIDEFLEQVADGHSDQLTHHQRSCRYCEAALAELAQMWAPIARTAAIPILIPAGAVAAMTATVMGEVRATAPATPTAAPTGPPARTPHPGRWISLIFAVIVIAATITGIVLATRHSGPTPRAVIATPTVAATTPQPTAAAPPPPPLAAPTTPRTGGLPTAVPAGSGGQAASSTSSARHRQFELLGVGLLLIGTSGYYLLRQRRRPSETSAT